MPAVAVCCCAFVLWVQAKPPDRSNHTESPKWSWIVFRGSMFCLDRPPMEPDSMQEWMFECFRSLLVNRIGISAAGVGPVSSPMMATSKCSEIEVSLRPRIYPSPRPKNDCSVRGLKLRRLRLPPVISFLGTGFGVPTLFNPTPWITPIRG